MRWPLLAGLAEHEVQLLLSVARRRVFARNEVVFHRGDPADSLHLIQKGRFGVRVTTPTGDSVMFAVLGPGECFGEIALVSADALRSATVVALEAGETRALHQIDVGRLRREHIEVADVLIGILARQVQRLSERVVEALFVPADRRVLRRVAELAQVYGDEDGGTASIPLTQEDIAALAGTSRATVNKVLRDEQRAGTIELRRGATIVLDRAGLAARAR